MAVLWWEQRVCVVCTKQRCFANKIIVDSMRVSPPRLVAKQTCWNDALSLGIWEDRSLDDDRSGGRGDGMEWCGLGSGSGLGLGLGFGEGEGRGGSGGEW